MAGLTPNREAVQRRVKTHRLNAGAFFVVRDGKVALVTNTYNLQDWLRQVGG